MTSPAKQNISSGAPETLRGSVDAKPSVPPAHASPRNFRLLTNPVFWSALVVKMVLGISVASHYPRDLFIPFVNFFVSSGFQNPWSHFAAAGQLDSFPYPPLMLYALAVPRLILHPFLGNDVASVTWGHLLALRATLLVADFGILAVLLRWFPTKQRRILALYWASPIAIYICYWHGQLDVIPTALFLLCLSLMHEKRFTWALIAYGAALATKTHLVSALPFLALYTFQERRWRGTLKAFGAGAATYVALLFPFVMDPAFRTMVFATGEQTRLFALQLSFGTAGSSILLAPGAILVLWFRFAAYPKWNWDLFVLYLGLLFCVFVLLIPPAPGYFLWSLPFVVYYLARQPKGRTSFYAGYVIAYLLFQALSENVSDSHSVHHWISSFSPILATQASNLAFTLMQASLGGIILGMHLFGVRSNSVYRLRTSPISIGLAGDSGAGKDRFVHLLTTLLGPEKMTVTSGDDYHRWPRGDAHWKEHTHLDVRANNLHQEHEHALELTRGESVVRKAYDHDTGKFLEGRAVDSNGYLIFSGLHSLSLDALRHLYDLSVFLDPEEALRQFWKTQRDVRERNYAQDKVGQTISLREKDREKYILPQRDHADLIVKFAPVGALPDFNNASPSSLNLSLELRGRNGFNWVSLAERLAQAPTLKVDHNPYQDTNWQTLSLTGEITADLLTKIAYDYIPNLEEITRKPILAANLEGCLQLVFLRCLSDKLRWKNTA